MNQQELQRDHEWPHDLGVAPMTSTLAHLAVGLVQGGGAKQLTFDGSVYHPFHQEGVTHASHVPSSR